MFTQGTSKEALKKMVAGRLGAEMYFANPLAAAVSAGKSPLGLAVLGGGAAGAALSGN